MIEVFSNGKKFSKWISATVNRSLDNIVSTFSLSVQPSGGFEKFGLFVGDEVEIKCNGKKVIEGFVEKISAQFSNGNHSISISGSEKTVDLVDCSLESPLEWQKKTISQIVGEICSNFGLKFSENGVDVGEKFKLFSAEPGSKAFETIAKACRERGILATSDGLGKVYLINPEKCDYSDSLIQGKNLLSASAEFSFVNRFSDYTVYGSGKAKDKVKASVKDEEVSRERKLVIVDANATKKENVQARAEFEKNSRIAKSLNVKCGLHGWENSKGIWNPGVICTICSPAIGISKSVDLLLNSVSFSWSMDSGEQTTLSFVSKDVYTPQPESKKTKVSKPGSADPWKSIKKAVKG